MIGAPPGSLVDCSESGYINSDLFVKWLKHFIGHVKTTTEKKVLLVLDGHSTHSNNLEAIKVARDNVVLLLQLPGHNTHRLQPLDVAIFKPLQTFYNAAICRWLRSNPGEKVKQFVVTALLAEAYSKAASLSNAANGFKATGIWPVDRAVFSEHDFVVSENLNSEQTSQAILNEPAEGLQENMVTVEGEDDDECEVTGENLQENLADSTRSSRTVVVHVSAISPTPEPHSNHALRVTKEAQKAEVLTSSPYKRKLEKVQEKKVKKKQRNDRRNRN
jgi:hypothetical protein